MALDRAGVLPCCPRCLTYTMEPSVQVTDDGVYLRCSTCYKSAIYKEEEPRGRLYHEERWLGYFECNWASGEIESGGDG